MHRFLIEPGDVQNGTVSIAGDDAKHMLQVLRFRVGDIFYAFDGSGLEYEVELTVIEKSRALGKVLRSYRPDTEPAKQVILFQGIPKTDKMDWIIQKSVELGVSKIVPVATQYSVVQVKDRGLEGKLERWNRIAREACKQSRRVIVPQVTAPVGFSEALRFWSDSVENAPDGAKLTVFCYENEGKKCLKDLFKCYNIDHVNAAGVFIGPEGGFSREEIRLAETCGFHPVSLGKRILRAETAAIAVLSVVMHEMGEWTT